MVAGHGGGDSGQENQPRISLLAAGDVEIRLLVPEGCRVREAEGEGPEYPHHRLVRRFDDVQVDGAG